ncbi:MAG: alpha/beta hydrolase [Candidatus Omnitrophota bacterium]
MMVIAKTTVTIIAGLIFLFFYARYLENKSLYYPVGEIFDTPEDINLEYENVFFYSEDKVKLNAWLIKAKNPRATIIFCHGNGGNISHRLDKIDFFYNLEVNLFIFDYRGYGQSQGKPSENGLYQDVQAAYKFIKDKQLGVPIILYGESLGGAIAIDLAAKSDFAVDGLILEGAFNNVKDMAKLIYPLLPAGLLKTKFDSIAKIAKIKVPKLHFHGKADDIVPIALGRKLFAAGNSPKKFITLEGSHNDCFFISQDLARGSVNEFIDSLADQP